MVLILLSVIVAAILISRIRNRNAIEVITRSGKGRGDFSIASGRVEQSRTADAVKPFLVVVLPDGTIVTSTVAG
jgi:hypothetical protein